ncbi:hypothetical protein GALMADRAFT_145512 [Galerina marginata CBS 339.88]|uniref:CFEM domain-containing protein n=1 Tax=Galerina marginata (strain CBS 339.88) TaxID=685588 RepID=A0A067SEY3_GALM3|nr:hypothetical protein GALMADRAFT_145512 [Galerina marginata CBS 339.88]
MFKSSYYANFNRGLLVILSLSIVLNYAGKAAGQSVGIDDLPACAGSCASKAAATDGCKLSDAACLCAHPDFTTSTVQCAQASCTIEDRAAVSGVLSQMCSTLPASSSSSTLSSTSSSSASQTSHNSGSVSSTSVITPATPPPRSPLPLSPTPVTPVVPISISTTDTGNSLTTSSSSTFTVVQTVDLPQTSSDPTSGALKVECGYLGFAFAFLLASSLIGSQLA